MKFLENEVSKIQWGAKYFIPNDNSITTLTPGTYGKGQVEYGEGSIYTGDIYFDGKAFNKIGFGEQDFSNSGINSDFVGGPIGSKLFLYVGEYDYTKTEWICGNGVFYFVNEKTGKPLCFIKGYFEAVVRVGEYQGEFDYSKLYPGFTKDMEIFELIPHQQLIHKIKQEYQSKNYDYLFVGDSWFEMWTYSYENNSIPNLFKKDLDGYSAVNIGIGGSTYNDWISLYPDFLTYYNAKKYIVNLGFNDLHSNTSIQKTFDNFIKFIDIIKKHNPNAEIYINSLTHTNNFPRHLLLEEEYNAKIEEYCNKVNYLHYCKVNLPFLSNNKPREDLDEYCIEDRVHLNYKGYLLWVKEIKKYIL